MATNLPVTISGRGVLNNAVYSLTPEPTSKHLSWFGILVKVTDFLRMREYGPFRLRSKEDVSYIAKILLGCSLRASGQ